MKVIWNTTFSCPWDCAFCCVSAGAGNRRQIEMSFQQKLAAADKLARIGCSVDLSGGEVMLNKREHLKLLERLSANLGRERVGLSCSGWGIDTETARQLSAVAGSVEMTMDAHPDIEYALRPHNYHREAANAGKRLKQYNMRVGFQTVITRAHYDNLSLLTDLYDWLCQNGIEEWSILKFFPSGRGEDYGRLELSDAENRMVVDFIRALDESRQSPGKPEINIHYLMPGSEKDSACRCVRKSVGILPDGRVTACFWGLSKEGGFINDKFYLGNVCTEEFDVILSGERAAFWLCRTGNCPMTDDDIFQIAA
jgi:MoaA/NifB/PqqE/SkfB family radical SAM enzyme